MRIVGGRWAGRDLESPGGRVRPTAEALRERWMEALADDLVGARVLDLYAGTGALGLEALSRGAKSVDFVENGPSALHALRANVARFKARRRCRIFVKDAPHFVARLGEDAYDLVLADPPYTSTLAERLVEEWRLRRFSSVLVVEHPPDRRIGGRGRTHRVGEGAFTVFRRRDGGGGSAATQGDGGAAEPG